MLFLNNAFTKDITEYDGEVLKEVKTVDGKIYLSKGHEFYKSGREK